MFLRTYCLALCRVGFAVLAQTIAAQAQQPNLRFDHLTTEQGLSQDIVTSIMQDAEGFMWFATEDGLNRYDGISFKVYKHNPRDSTTLISNFLRFLTIDRANMLWVVAQSSLYRYNRASDSFDHFPVEGEILSLCADQREGVWVGTTRGLKKVDHGKVVSPRVALLDSARVAALFPDDAGFLWIGSADGLYRYQPLVGVVEKVYPAKGDKTEESADYNLITEDSGGMVWFGIKDKGLRRLDPKSGIVEKYVVGRKPGGLVDQRVLSLLADRSGNLWVGTFNGLHKYVRTTNTFLYYSNNPYDTHSLSGDRVYSMYQDRDGAIWIGTYRGGVNKIDPLRQRFVHYINFPDKPAFQGTSVFALHEDQRGDLWIGTDSSGVSRYVYSEGRILRYSWGRNWGVTLSICSDHENRIWFGTETGDLVCFDPVRNVMRQYSNLTGRGSNAASVRALFTDHSGIVWIGCENDDLLNYDGRTNRFTRIAIENGKPIGVWHISEVSNGDLLLGTMYGSEGVYRFKRDSGVAIAIKGRGSPGEIKGSVRASFEDSSGMLWLGAWQGGLYCYDPTTDQLQGYTESDGLANNFVKGMLADDHGNLWISTENGLSRFNMKSHTFKTFTTREGLANNFFWSGSCWKGRDGWMYFGGINGIDSFHPDSVRDNPGIPPVVITRFTALNVPIQLSQPESGPPHVRLDHEQDYFSIEFVALNYTVPEKNRYKYKMEGFDIDWIDAGTRRFASYTHLDPGTYTFRVQGSNNDGVWNKVGASLLITILPPYWQTWWFRGLTVLLLGGSLYGIYLYRVRRLLEMERLRGRIAADLHDDVGSELGHIAIAGQLLVRKGLLPPKEQQQLSNISMSALHASDMMKEVVWLLNPRNDSLASIIVKMRSLAGEQLEGVDVTFDSPQGELPETVDLQSKRNIYLMYKEIIHNIAKHARARHVSIRVEYQSHHLLLVIKDDGIGFDVAQARGNGLQNIRTRATQIGAELSIASALGRGTTITVSAKV